MRSLKCSEQFLWLSHAAFFVEADCSSACLASITVRTCATPAQPFTQLDSIALSAAEVQQLAASTSPASYRL